MAMDTSSGLPAGEEVTVSQAGPAPADTEPSYAGADLLIERADLGPGCSTRVNAGDRIPASLAGLPRRPATPTGRTR